MIGDVTLAPWSIVIVDVWMWTPYVMLICLAGLRSIPDYIYEAAEVDRASPWRQFWTITLPMALPFIMLAVLFRGIENFKMFDMVNLLTNGGPGSTTELASITLKREAFEKWRTGYSSALRHHPVRHDLRSGQHLRQGAQPGEAAMSTASPPPIRSSRRAPLTKRIAGTLVIIYALITMVPLVWIIATSIQVAGQFDRLSAEDPVPALRSRATATCSPTRSRQTPEYHRAHCRRRPASATRSRDRATW